MAVRNRLMGVGFSAAQTEQLSGPGAQGLTATGTTSADALVVSTQAAAFSTVGSGTGAILSSSYLAGDKIFIYNGGSSTLTIYPDAASTLDNTTSQTIVTKKGIMLFKGTDTTWVSFKST